MNLMGNARSKNPKQQQQEEWRCFTYYQTFIEHQPRYRHNENSEMVEQQQQQHGQQQKVPSFKAQ